MMQRMFHRGNHEVPALNTSSLPDLIFTVLFFFMIVTHMRTVELKVRYEVPQGTELQKLGHKSAVSYIYVGRVMNSSYQAEGEMQIQLNDQIATVDEIKAYLEEERRRMSPEDQARMTVSIKADRDTPMGMIVDIKHALQHSFALKINYSASEK
jgi:biopolymer transport protein ExbD